jgi:hypothetical protein
MPNTCDIRWTITGQKAELDRFLAQCITYDDGKPWLNLLEECTGLPGYWRCYDDCTKLERESDAIKLEFCAPFTPVLSAVLEVIAERFPALMIEGDLWSYESTCSWEFRLRSGKWDYKNTSAQLEAELARKIDEEYECKLATEGK